MVETRAQENRISEQESQERDFPGRHTNTLKLITARISWICQVLLYDNVIDNNEGYVTATMLIPSQFFISWLFQD